MKTNFFIFKIVFIIFSLITKLYSNEYKELPIDIKAALFIRILELNKTICDSCTQICIHVINDTSMYNALQKVLGTKINEKEIKIITQTENDILPPYTPSVIYVGNSENADKITEYTQKNKILSVSGNPMLIESGITVSIVMLYNAPNIILKKTSSKNEEMKWDYKMMKISSLI